MLQKLKLKLSMLQFFLATILFAGFVNQANCAPQGLAAQERNIEDINANDGIVIDQTITMIGQAFYQSFVALWREKARVDRYSLAVRERPSARQGSQVWIEFGQKRVFQSQLPSNRSKVQELAEQAVEIAHDNIVDADVESLLFRDPDLAQDEM
jgi:curli production assembly/transport component CsgE